MGGNTIGNGKYNASPRSGIFRYRIFASGVGSGNSAVHDFGKNMRFRRTLNDEPHCRTQGFCNQRH